MMRCILLSVALLSGCDAAPDSPAPEDTQPATPVVDEDAGSRVWPASGPIKYKRDRGFDFDGDGTGEQVSVTARGTSFDSLTIVLAITNMSRDTLWREEWHSLQYFNYDPREGKADSTVARIVMAHIDTLLTDDKFSQAGLPPQLSHGVPRQTMLDAVHYHLAELGWRKKAGLAPAPPTPSDAHSAISVDSIPMERANAVVDELMKRPSFTYHAGGEVTYAIAWSASQKAFVRVFSCC